MDDELEEILIFLNSYLQSKLSTCNIKTMKWETEHYSFQEVPKTTKYDNFKLEDILALYKIKKLLSLNIINDKLATQLKNILYIKKKLENKLESLIFLDKDIECNKELISKICKKIIKIEEKLNKYNLTNIKLDLTKIIDNDIKNEYLCDTFKNQLNLYNYLENKENDQDKTIDYLNIKIKEKITK